MSQKKQNKSKSQTKQIENELKLLKEDLKKSKSYLESLKKQFANEIKNAKQIEIKNTVIVENKINIWQRLKKVLGMS